MNQVASAPITIPKKIDYYFSGTIYSDAAQTQPFDLTGWEANFEIVIGNDTVVFGPEPATLGGEEGTYTVLVPRATTEDLDPCKARYRMFLTDPDGFIPYAVYGPAEIISI